MRFPVWAGRPRLGVLGQVGCQASWPPKTRIGGERIVDQDLAGKRWRKAGGEHVIVRKLPVRKIGRGKQHLLGLQLIPDSANVRRRGRCVKGLDGQADMIAGKLLRRAVEPGYLEAHAAPEFGEPPKRWREPSNAGFDQYNLKLGVFDEHTLANQACELRLKAQCLGCVVRQVVTGPAGAGQRMMVAAAGVDADGEAVPL